MEVNEDLIREQYRNMTNQMIEQIFLYEKDDLRPEALAILYSEIRSRGIYTKITESTKIVNEGISDSDNEYFTKKIQDLPCPICESVNNKINIVQTKKIIGVVTNTITLEPIIIACPECIKKEAKKALIFSIVFGWWSIAGPFATIDAILHNKKLFDKKQYVFPTIFFRSFVKENALFMKRNIDSIKNANDLLF